MCGLTALTDANDVSRLRRSGLFFRPYPTLTHPSTPRAGVPGTPVALG